MEARSRKKAAGPAGWKAPVILAALVALIAVVSLAGYGYSKFLTQKTLTGNVTVDSRLAGSFKLFEHKAAPAADGSYTLSTDETVLANEYKLIPGIDLPKDPFLTITDKTNIPAYLYVEVIDSKLPAGRATYELTADWKKLEGVSGYHGGDVYVYAPGGSEKVLTDQNTTSEAIKILKNDQVKIEQGSGDYNHEPFTGTAQALDFYGYLLQKGEGQSAAAVFTENIPAGTVAP